MCSETNCALAMWHIKQIRRTPHTFLHVKRGLLRALFCLVNMHNQIFQKTDGMRAFLVKHPRYGKFQDFLTIFLENKLVLQSKFMSPKFPLCLYPPLPDTVTLNMGSRPTCSAGRLLALQCPEEGCGLRESR